MNEPDLSFAHARHKLQRANKHIIEAESDRLKFLEGSPPDVVLKTDPNTRRLSIVVNPPSRIPANIPCAVGDAAHNIRAALDYCWMGLVRRVHPNPGKRTFPFSKDPKSLEGTILKALEDLPVKGLKEIMLDLVKPYERRDSFLYPINQIDNRDKHNLLTLHVASTEIIELDLSTRGGRTFSLRNTQVTSGRAISPVAVFDDPADPFEPHGEASFAVEVFIGDPLSGQRPLIPFLAGALHEAAEVVKVFEDEFGGDRFQLAAA